MVQIAFSNMDRSELARSFVLERFSECLRLFPASCESHMAVDLTFVPSQESETPDLFRIQLRVQGGTYGGVFFEASAPSLFVAIEHLLRRLEDRLRRIDKPVRKRQLDAGVAKTILLTQGDTDE